MEHFEKIEVTDKQSFIKLVEALEKDFQKYPDKWENKTISTFLYAIASYTEDIQGYYKNLDIPEDSEIASWRRFADILKGARVYD